MLLVTDGEIPKQRGEDNSAYWKSGTEYIKIFNDFRNYSSKTHKKLQGEQGNPMEGSYKLFDQYEELFLETISNISEEIGLQHVEIDDEESS